MTTPEFKGGINIAIKIPKHKYEETIAFYRDTLNLSPVEQPISNPTVSRTHKLKFGHNTVWLDCVDNYTHSETWLELTTDDVPSATQHLRERNVPICDEFEQLPDNMHWITDPAGTVFILKNPDAD